jgi:hypothetical protein
VDLNVTKPTLGPWLTFDPKAERFTGSHAAEANKYVREDMRSKFSISETI